MGRTLIGLLIATVAALAVAAPASAVQPKSGFWFSTAVDRNDEDNLSSIQFNVANSRTKLVRTTIFWRCGNQSGYYNFKNPPIPTGIKRERFKLVGEATPPTGELTRDFTLTGKFISRTKARYSMTLKGCGPKTTGQLTYADN